MIHDLDERVQKLFYVENYPQKHFSMMNPLHLLIRESILH